MDPFLTGKQILSGKNDPNVWETEILNIGLEEIKSSPCNNYILT